jgi:hypothetical protein
MHVLGTRQDLLHDEVDQLEEARKQRRASVQFD